MDEYKFKLQKVLDYRTSIEDDRKEEFVEAQRAMLNEQHRLEKLLAMKENELNKPINLKTSFEYQSYFKYIEFLNSKIEDQRQSLENCKNVLEEKKEELVEAMKEKKVMEKLKEKSKEEFENMVNSKDQKLNDDFALFSYVKLERR